MLLKQEYWISKSFVFYNNNSFENWKLYTIKNPQRFDACNASYSCDNRNDKIVIYVYVYMYIYVDIYMWFTQLKDSLK